MGYIPHPLSSTPSPLPLHELHLPHLVRWVLAPTRFDPETKMPKFADDKGKTQLTDFYEGEAARQFEAMWQNLQTSANEARHRVSRSRDLPERRRFMLRIKP